MKIKVVPECNGSPIPYYYYGIMEVNMEEYEYILSKLPVKDVRKAGEATRIEPYMDIESLRTEFFEGLSDAFQRDAKYVDVVIDPYAEVKKCL